MSAVDTLRLRLEHAVEHGWDAVALSVGQAADLLAVARRVAELEAAGRRCADCGRAGRGLVATADGDGGVVYLGPGCLRKRLKKAVQQAQPLPIGGTR